MAHAETSTVRNPGPLPVNPSLRMILMAFAFIGVVTFVIGLTLDGPRTWSTFLHNHFYFMSLAIGGLFFASVQWITGAMWSAPIRRLSESLSAFLPISLVTFLILYFGMHDLYIWSVPEHVKGDLMLEGKTGYLNTGFFMIRDVIALGIWIFFQKKLIGNSVAQDANGDPVYTARNRVLTAPFLILFALTYTMVSFDQLMSLDPHWFSTMFGIYCFAGLFYSTLALTGVLSVYLRRSGALKGIVTEDHLHDLGKFMFAFTVFWAYIGFSQFMLIWYANLPEETGYFVSRMTGGWLPVSIFLLVGKFMVPFFLLIRRDAKRSEKMILGVGWFMLVAQWIDFYWIIQPNFFRGGPVFGLIEIGVTLGFVGLFGLSIVRFLNRNTVVAIGDPRLAEAVFHHHQ